MDPTIDHTPASLPPELADGVQLALTEEDQGPSAGLARWLAAHPEQAAELARFLAAQHDLRALLDPVPPADPGGTTVGGYELKEELGRGGMGIVYRAFDPVLKREVALKRVLAGPYLSADERARFRFEAEAAASLDHPNIVRVHAFGDAGGTPYLVMPLLTGGTLATYLKALGPDRRLPPLKAAELVRDLSAAVHHAHQRGLLHRDLKPANVLLDADDRPHVADFGLARPLGRTVTGGVAGTAAYMAPEQARGDRVLTTAVDIHALGAILFELLTGRPPFGTGEFAAVLRRVADEPVPPVRSDRPDVPADLAAVCQRCLEKQPEDRYPSAGDLADDLTRFNKGEPVEARSHTLLTSLDRALRWRREPTSPTGWKIAFWGAAWSLAAIGAIQAAVLLDAPAAVVRATLAGYMVGWLAVVWSFFIARRDALNPIERASLALHLGLFLAALSVIGTQLWLHDGDVLPIFPPLGAVLGLMVFAHGLHYWGRLYALGVIAIAVSAAMPLVTKVYWPAVYGLTVAGCQAWAGVQLRRYSQEWRAAADRWRTESPHPPP